MISTSCDRLLYPNSPIIPRNCPSISHELLAFIVALPADKELTSELDLCVFETDRLPILGIVRPPGLPQRQLHGLLALILARGLTKDVEFLCLPDVELSVPSRLLNTLSDVRVAPRNKREL